jgi:hypothetical protein
MTASKHKYPTKLAREAQARTVHGLRAAGKTVREIARETGLTKSAVSRRLALPDEGARPTCCGAKLGEIHRCSKGTNKGNFAVTVQGFTKHDDGCASGPNHIGRCVLPPKRTHLIIPDCQVHAGVPTQHLEWIGRYIAHKRPDVIVCIGDFADMPSLSFYDKGKKSFEGRRYALDIEAAREAMGLLVREFRDVPGYKPRMVLTLGNHEDRITKAVNDSAVLDGTIGIRDLAYESFGWEVFPYLQIVKIDGVEYAHYFKGLGAKGFPVSSAKALLNARGGSAVMGHTQHTDVAFHAKTQQIGIFCGTCYLHDEEYLGEQGNVQRRQIVVLHEVEDGRCDPMFVSLDFLRRRYSAPERKAA